MKRPRQKARDLKLQKEILAQLKVLVMEARSPRQTPSLARWLAPAAMLTVLASLRVTQIQPVMVETWPVMVET